MHSGLSQNIICLIFFLFVFIFGAGTVNSQITNLRFTGNAGYYAGSQFNPLPDVQVELLDANNNILGKANTDAQGRFEIHIPHTTNCTPTPAYHVDLFSQIWTFQEGSGAIVGCLAPGYHSFGNLNMIRVLSVSFEDAYTDQTSSNPNTGGGLRIYPDKKTPTDSVNRKMIKIRMWTTTSQSVVTVFYKIFDLDDPSANIAPIDANGSAGGDNRATNSSPAVNLLQSKQINPFSSGLVEFTTTMQPGDNFAVVAGASAAYVNGVTVDGANLKDAGGNIITISDTSPRAAHRTEMLTVWRRLHIEVDSMGNVGNVNNVTGTVNGTVTIPRSSGLNPGTGTVNVTTGSSLDLERFQLGRMIADNDSLVVISNTGNSLVVKNITTRNITLSNGRPFTLYDDDDYNANDSTIAAQNLNITSYLVDGDNSEQIVQLSDSFRYLSTEEGNYSDGNPKNVYASAYITPEYNWAQNIANYNQTNVAFDLNVSSDQTNSDELFTVLNTNRNSNSDERDDFWIAYFLIGYQGNNIEDADGCKINLQTQQCIVDAQNQPLPESPNPGISKRLLTSTAPCDCYQSTVCPAAVPGNSAPTACTAFPTGAFGSLVYQEVQQDIYRTWLLLTGLTVQELPTTASHELGHQLGLLGDQRQTTFKLMDYSFLPSTVNDVVLHPEHINIIRHRVKSPGQ